MEFCGGRTIKDIILNENILTANLAKEVDLFKLKQKFVQQVLEALVYLH